MNDYVKYLIARGMAETTIRQRLDQLKRIERNLNRPLDKASTLDLESYIAQAGQTKEYKRAMIAAMRGYYTFLVRNGTRPDNPATDLARIKPAEPSALPASDIAFYSALKSADRRERLMLMLAGVEGMRRSEVAQVYRTDLVSDLFGFSLVVHGKGDKTRVLPLKIDIARELEYAFSVSSNGFAFPGADHGHLSAAYVGKLISRLLPDGVSMHSLRHRAVTNVHRRGHDMLLTQKFAGHASPVTTQRYVHQSSEDLRRLIV